ncbi:MAG TPA: Nif3-like dinuclear metal center hexameric protein, partial [Clostridia bacterium]|nr:Nif3-like dinuclear metal center hexameric protein [Clostridia bacterium]
PDAVKAAAAKGCNLLVTHHPHIFKPIKAIDTASFSGRVLELILKNNINHYACHTNLDVAKGGVSWRLAELLGLTEIRRLMPDGMGVVGKISTFLAPLAKKVAQVLDDKTVCVVGDGARRVSAAAIVAGAGGGDAEAFKAALDNSDVFITSEIKHHLAVEADAMGRNLIGFSHYSSEIVALDILKDIIKSRFGGLRVEIHKGARPIKSVYELE